jgi:peptidoglycan/xylan/chitin deacetylase (PgdA/CDA1 family)
VRRRLVSLLPSPVARVLALAVLFARRASGAQVGLVLVYHRLAPIGGCPQRELVAPVAVAAFRAQLDWLGRFYRVVPARQILAAAAERRRWQRYPIAITFDDDWPSHVRWALPALRSAGIPSATFFLSGASLDRPLVRWWDRLQAAVDAGLGVSGLLPGEDIHAMGEAMKRRSPSERAAVEAALVDLGANAQPVRVTEEQLREIARDQEIGFHTLGHELLPGLSDEDLEEAVTAGRDRLEALCGRPIDLVAYPHGAAGAREAAAARAACFRMGFTTVAAVCGPSTDPLLIGRAEPGHAPLGLFALKIERALARNP